MTMPTLCTLPSHLPKEGHTHNVLVFLKQVIINQNHKSKQTPRISYYFKKTFYDGEGWIFLKEIHTHTHKLITLENTPTLYTCLLRLYYSENHVTAPTVTVKIGNSHLLTTLLKYDMARKSRKKCQ